LKTKYGILEREVRVLGKELDTQRNNENSDINSNKNWIKVQASKPVLPSPRNLDLQEKKIRHRLKQNESGQTNRREIRISLVEGMVYDESGKDMTHDTQANATFIELNYRKRSMNELQNTNMPSSPGTYRYIEKELSESDYVAKFIEQAAVASGIQYSLKKQHQEISPIRKRMTDKRLSGDVINENPEVVESTPVKTSKTKIKFADKDAFIKSNSFTHQEIMRNQNELERNRSILVEKDKYFVDRKDGRSLFQNISIDSRLEVRNDTGKFEHRNATIDQGTIRSGKILSNMTFQMKSHHQEYEDREKEAKKVTKNVPSMIAKN
jgi:hypothetical protein